MNFRTIPYTISRKGIPVPSSDSDSNIDRLNSQLENILRAGDPDTTEWDEDIKHQIKMGHIKNRIKIRFNVLTHPGRYSSFILKDNGDRRLYL
ncbi:MAG: hypothetical protein IPJ37_17580 [Bacteroidales bacterium]|nr:hypothetical protein [Bacteroidales bacterium]